MIRFRTASNNDARSIAQMHVTSWRSAYAHFFDPIYLDERIEEERLTAWTRQLASPTPDHRAIIAEDDDRPAGFTYVIRDHDSCWGSLVDNLHVMPGLKGGGLGRRLLAEAARWSLEAYPDGGLYLWCFEDNVGARGFYDRAGGTVVERIEKPAFDGQIRSEFRYHWPDPKTLTRD